MADSPLRQLAGKVGIEPDYQDIWGNRIPASDPAICAVLAAMGIPADDPRQVLESLDDLTGREWERLLPPVSSMEEGGDPGVEISLPVVPAGSVIHFALMARDGAAQMGDVEVTALALLADATVGGVHYVRRWLKLPHVPAGWYRLSVRLEVKGSPPREDEGVLIVAPDRCFRPIDLLGEGKAWGIGVQLYGVRSAANWGMGDFADLARLMGIAGGLGADFVGVNPIHAAFPADPNNFGPYGPSHRSFLNILYIALPDVPEYAESDDVRAMVEGADFQRRLETARSAELVDYPAVSALKMPVLEACFRQFQRDHLSADTNRARDFQLFREERGEPLRRLTLFDALHEHCYRRGEGEWFWRHWPEEFRGPLAPGAVRFAEDHAERLDFFAWTQFEAQRQLDAASRAAAEAGMRIGLYRDMAVGNSPGGAAAWSYPDVVLPDASVGAPPDLFSPLGQNWGLAALSPVGLRESAHAIFVQDLAANMRGSGAVRIDHVMALQHLFWVPGGLEAKDGVYVEYPFADLRRILKLESRQTGCVVVGEDLGTVPEGFRPVMRDAGTLSTRLLWFERGEDGAFLPPEHYEAQSLVGVTTHDLPTLKGWWEERDIDWRDRLSKFKEKEDADKERAERRRDRERLLASLGWAGVLPSDTTVNAEASTLPPELPAAVHRYLARSHGRLLMVQMEDLTGEVEQPNLPGTLDEHPNWRRRLSVALEDLADFPTVRAVAAAIAEERPRTNGDGG